MHCLMPGKLCVRCDRSDERHESRDSGSESQNQHSPLDWRFPAVEIN